METNGLRGLYPPPDREEEAVAPGLIPNSLEFAGIEPGVVELLPDAEEQHRVLGPQPLLDQCPRAVETTDHVGERDVVLLVARGDAHHGPLDDDAAALA